MAFRVVVRPDLARRVARALVFGAALAVVLVAPLPARAAAPAAEPGPSFPFDAGDCGPPSTTIPGPPPDLIDVGRAMSDSWLMCYIKQDFEGQTFSFDRWGEARKTSFQGYPVECWTPEAGPDWQGRRTEGIVAEAYGWNLDHTQYVVFTYRIQLDGDYINNCHQEILPTP
jgi:hypothetical protein